MLVGNADPSTTGVCELSTFKPSFERKTRLVEHKTIMTTAVEPLNNDSRFMPSIFRRFVQQASAHATTCHRCNNIIRVLRMYACALCTVFKVHTSLFPVQKAGTENMIHNPQYIVHYPSSSVAPTYNPGELQVQYYSNKYTERMYAQDEHTVSERVRWRRWRGVLGLVSSETWVMSPPHLPNSTSTSRSVINMGVRCNCHY